MTETRPPADPFGRPELPRRFYREAGIAERDGAFALVLDGRAAKTPAKRPLAVASRALAEALAAEWQAQGERIDPATMPMTRIANAAIDGIADDPKAVADDIVKYAGSDLLCYRAGEPEALVEAQSAGWDPVLAWCRDELGALLILSEGIAFARQPDRALAAIGEAVSRFTDPVALGALHTMTTLSGSAVLALATALGRLAPEEAWRLAHIDETHQEAFWGEDEEAMTRRRRRGEEFAAAARIVALAGPGAP